jgi:hypothetical protein
MPRRRSRLAFAAALGALASAPGGSAAAPSADAFEALLDQAEAALNKKRPREALSAWRAAWSIKQEPLLACNIGRAEQRHGSPREAAEFLSICLRLAPAPVTPDDKKRRALFETDMKLARRRVASVRVEPSESGASIQVDGRDAGLSPLPDEIFLTPGEHKVSAALKGYEPAEVAITVKEGESRTLPLTLIKTAPVAKPPPLPPPLLPLAHWRPLPAEPPAASKLVIAGGVSFSTATLGLGVALLIARGVVKEEADRARQLVRVHVSPDCKPGVSIGSCPEYLSAQEIRAAMKGGAAASFVGAGLSAAATVVYVLFPRLPIAPSIAKGGGLKLSF